MQKSVGWVLVWFGAFNLLVSLGLFTMGKTTGQFIGVPGMIVWSIIFVVMGATLHQREEPRDELEGANTRP